MSIVCMISFLLCSDAIIPPAAIIMYYLMYSVEGFMTVNLPTTRAWFTVINPQVLCINIYISHLIGCITELA